MKEFLLKRFYGQVSCDPRELSRSQDACKVEREQDDQDCKRQDRQDKFISFWVAGLPCILLILPDLTYPVILSSYFNFAGVLASTRESPDKEKVSLTIVYYLADGCSKLFY